MSADIITFRPATLSQAEAARRRAMLLHPSNFNPSSAPAGDTAKKAEELAGRFDTLYKEFLARGLSVNEARTEVARTAAQEIWDGLASQLRRHRAAGQQLDANVLAVALASIQCMTRALPRRLEDLDHAVRTVNTARRRLQYNGGLLHRLHPHRNPVFQDAEVTLQSLEVFLAHPQHQAA
ncbi:hypothetical protein J7I84_02915 [Arthrobacter sp. ISL-85]|uniref:hypothetical protein n=1 Tax=Arthrobacter sp. ISL-85 TaxID=2819115 RepID=UPI001BEA36E5|nr:hypothetical protein [Arthrobacter sp. ISL-85]MBT2565458.1 hypothetical protein [Arthrobacter sp. ISL-85]